MTLGGDIAGALGALRAEAESTMRSVCRITRPGASVWNPVTLQNETEIVTVYAGVCRVRSGGTQDAAANAADQEFLESRYVLSLPVKLSTGVAKDDVVEITADVTDSALVGRKFTVTSVPAQSDAAVRRIPVAATQ